MCITSTTVSVAPTAYVSAHCALSDDLEETSGKTEKDRCSQYRAVDI